MRRQLLLLPTESELLRTWRKRKSLTLVQVHGSAVAAGVTGLAPSSLSKLELGRRSLGSMAVRQLALLASLYELHAEEVRTLLEVAQAEAA